MNSLDLFCGCGGLTLGFEMAGCRSVLMTDIDEHCRDTVALNMPDVPFLCKDVSQVTPEEVRGIIGDTPIDLVLGGPPCQGFSLANKKRNKVKDDPRNKLFYHFVRMVDEFRPSAFVMENVKGILSMKGGEVMEHIIEALATAGDGYRLDYRILRASDYGVPQHRERVIIIGIREDLDTAPAFPKPEGKEVTVLDAISDLPPIKAGEGTPTADYATEPKSDFQAWARSSSSEVRNHIAMRHTARIVERFKAIKPGKNLTDVWETHGSVQRGDPNKKSSVKFSQNNQRVHGDRPSPTIAASFQSNFIHPVLDRNFTAREGARIQSFPDHWQFAGPRTKMSWEKGLSQYQQIGNAVPPLLAHAIARTLLATLEKAGKGVRTQMETA